MAAADKLKLQYYAAERYVDTPHHTDGKGQLLNNVKALFGSIVLNSGQPNEIFCVSAEMQKEAWNKNVYQKIYRKDRKRNFLRKPCLSAEIA